MANKFGLSSFLPKSKTLNSSFEWISHLDPALRDDDDKQNEEEHNIVNQENKNDEKNKKKRNKNEDMEDIELAVSDEMIYDQDYDDQELPSGVVIPFFNEPSHELQQTLDSLDRTWEQLRKAAPNKWVDNTMTLCLIQDGWSRADPSMKEHLKAIFPKQMEDGTY